MEDISLLESIAEIDPREWDELAREDVLASHAWLRLIEETSLTTLRCRCLMAREGSKLQAAIFFWRQHRHDNTLSLDKLFFGRLAKWAGLIGLTVFPLFVGGEVVGWRRTILFRNDLSADDRRRLLAQMLPFLETAARSVDHTLCFRGILSNEAELTEVFSTRDYLCTPELPVCCLEIEWDSFAGYLLALKSQHPRTERNIRYEINQFRRSGITIERLEDPAGVCGRLHEVVDSHHRRLNGRPFPYRPEFFEQLKSRLGDKAIIYAAVTGERIVGVLVMLCSDEEASLPIVGIDPEYFRKDALYFNLVFNRPIRDAIEAGLRRVYYGRLVYDVKLWRGCRLVDSNIYLMPRCGLGGTLLQPLMALRTWKMRAVRNSLTGQGTGIHGNAGKRR